MATSAPRESTVRLVEDDKKPDCEEVHGHLLPISRFTLEEVERKKGCLIPHVGLVMAVVSSLFFSLCSLIVKVVVAVDPMQHATMRFTGLLLPSLAIVIYKEKDPTGDRGMRFILLVRSVLGAAGLMLQFYAFRHMPLADASVLVFSAPVFVAIFARCFLKEPCGFPQVLSIMLTLVGVVFIARPPFLFGGLDSPQRYTMENLLGASAALGGTVCSANVYILLRKLKVLHYAVIMLVFSMVGILMSYLANLAAPHSPCLPCDSTDRAYLVLLGLFSFLGQLLLTKALQLEQAGPVSICRTADIVFAFIWQVAFLGESPTLLSGIGAVLVTTSVFIMGFRKWMLELPIDSKIRRRFSMFAV